jgi:hypothetical protein
MNEAETRAELIDPALKAAGWGVVEASRVRREVITLGRLQGTSKSHSARNVPYLVEYVGAHRRRIRLPRGPIATQLDPAVVRAGYARLRKPRLNFRVWPWICSKDQTLEFRVTDLGGLNYG